MNVTNCGTVRCRLIEAACALLLLLSFSELANAARAEAGGWISFWDPGMGKGLPCNSSSDHQNSMITGWGSFEQTGAQFVACGLFFESNNQIKLAGTAEVLQSGKSNRFLCPVGKVLVSLRDYEYTVAYACQGLAGATLSDLKPAHSFGKPVDKLKRSTIDASTPESKGSVAKCEAGEVAIGGEFDSPGSTNNYLICTKFVGTVEPGSSLKGFSKESSAEMGSCSVGAELIDGAIVSRSHEGDENGPTAYLCARFYQNGKRLILSGSEDIKDFSKESEAKDFQCGPNKVMTGRSHSGDENGKTTYWCQGFKETTFNGDITVTNKVESSREEKASRFDCSPGVFVGRYHSGDENGTTKVTCGELY